MGSFKIDNPQKKEKLVKEPQILKISDCDFLVSFKHLDKNQGDSLEKWEEEKKLAQLISIFQGYSSRKLMQCVDREKFVIYGDFPPKDKTEFFHPKHVTSDAKWARIHLNGDHIIAGHIIENIFYLVFLDGKHKFWKSEKKGT